MSQANVEVVRELYEAFGQGDIPAVRQSLDPRVHWYEAESFPYADRNPYVGPEAVLDGVYSRLVEEWEGFREELESVLDAGEQVVTTGYYTGTYKATRMIVRAQFAHLWTLQAGQITAFQQYTDTAQFARATSGDWSSGSGVLP